MRYPPEAAGQWNDVELPLRVAAKPEHLAVFNIRRRSCSQVRDEQVTVPVPVEVNNLGGAGIVTAAKYAYIERLEIRSRRQHQAEAHLADQQIKAVHTRQVDKPDAGDAGIRFEPADPNPDGIEAEVGAPSADRMGETRQSLRRAAGEIGDRLPSRRQPGRQLFLRPPGQLVHLIDLTFPHPARERCGRRQEMAGRAEGLHPLLGSRRLFGRGRILPAGGEEDHPCHERNG